MEKLNHWLTLLANLGVLIGIIFLSTEIRQANRIATNATEATLSELGHEVGRDELEYSSLLLKLQSETPELTSLEDVQARILAFQYVNYWSSISSAYRSGQVTDFLFQIFMNNIERILDLYPGFIHYYAELAISNGWRDDAIRGQSPVVELLLIEISNAELSNSTTMDFQSIVVG